MYDFPIKYYEDNLIVNKNSKDCWACFEIMGVSYDYLSVDKKIMRLNSVTRFISNIGEAKVLIVPVAQDIKAHYANLRGSLNKNDKLYDYAMSHATGTEGYLLEQFKNDGPSNDYVIYVIVKLTASRSTAALLESLIKRPVMTINELFEVEYKELLISDLKAFTEASDAYFAEQDKRLHMKKTDAQTTQWLIRRIFRRGIPERIVLRKGTTKGEPWSPYKEDVMKDGQRAIRPYERDILSLTESMIEPGHRYIKVTGSDGKISYQTFMTMAHIPDALLFPGGEWLLMLQDYPVASEVCMHITTTEHRESVRRLSGKKREIKSQIEHVAENDQVPDELFEAQESADALEAELKQGRDPLTQVSISICVAAENLKDMETQASFIKDRYEDVNFVIERPMADQFKLFMEFIPGSKRLMNDYVLQLPPRTVAGSMFPVVRTLGDNMGPFIGTTGVLHKMVFLDMARACQLNRSASATFLGTLGGGKSFNANLLLYLNVMYGGKAFVIDPKGERSGWPDMIPELKDHMSITTLSAGDEDRGKLDPFLIYKNDLEAAGELAINILCELFKINPKDDEYTAILEAVRRVKMDVRPCMAQLTEYLNGFSDSDELKLVAKKIGRRIDLLQQAGMAKLLIGEGNEQGLSFDKRINILQIQNLQMPDPTTPKEDYTQEETISTVLMLPIASFAKKFAMSDRSIFKLVLFDESWALNSTAMGTKLFNFLARMGRSLNAGAIFIGHSVNDLKGDGIKAAITYKFCFKSTVNEEIERVLDFLDLEVTDENMGIVNSLENGVCLFQDLDGRVGKLKFEAVYEHIIKAFNTTPDKLEDAR